MTLLRIARALKRRCMC